MSEIRVLNLGAGKQSTVIYLMARCGEIPRVDYAVFADAQEEKRLTYEHLTWLKGINDPPILTGTAGKLGDHLIAGNVGVGGRKRTKVGLDGTNRFVCIPAFTARHHESRPALIGCEQGQVRRQCTKEYKVEVVDRVIRRQILGLKPRQRVPKGGLNGLASVGLLLGRIKFFTM